MAKLSGGVAVIKVGAATEIELKERKARVEDALSATRSAVEEGIVPGGGVALVRAQRALDSVGEMPLDEKVGVDIIRRALEQPLKLIVENAGFEGAVVLNQVKQQADDYGYDAEVGEYGPMLERGIVDPAKVTPLGPAERSQRCGHGPDHRVHDLRDSTARVGYARHAPGRRNGLLVHSVIFGEPLAVPPQGGAVSFCPSPAMDSLATLITLAGLV